MVFKRRRERNGKVVKSRYWYGQYRDGEGKLLRVKLAPDKREAERLMAEHVAHAQRVHLGSASRYTDQEKRPLVEHLRDYGAALEADNDTPDHISRTLSSARQLIQGCGFQRIPEISASRVKLCLADQRRRRGWGAVTSNSHLRAVKGFTRWLLKDGRTGENRLAHLESLKPDADLRHKRRALSEDEALRLVLTAERGPVVMGVSGPLRALCYRLALTTGLRRNEIRSLTWAHLSLDGPEPTVTVEAAYSKHRRRDVLPLTRSMAKALRRWKAERPSDGPVFPLPQKTAKMVRADLEAAEVEYRDGTGQVVDFHALRHTFITNLVLGGVHPKVAQTFARHSTFALTMDIYTHLQVLDHRQALDVLPELGDNAEAEQARRVAAG